MHLALFDSFIKQHVVRCPYCNEATPLKPPPTGKRLVNIHKAHVALDRHNHSERWS